MGKENSGKQEPDGTIELKLFGPVTLSGITGELDGLRPQMQLLLGMLVIDGDRQFQIADDRIANYLWGQTIDADPGPWERKKLTRALHELNGLLKGKDGSGRGRIKRYSGLTQLVDVVVDLRAFDLAYHSRDWSRAIELAERGRILEGVRVRRDAANARDWLDRIRHRYAIRLDHCYNRLAHELGSDPSQIDQVIDLVSRRQRFAESAGIENRSEDIDAQLDRLHALQTAQSSDPTMPPNDSSADDMGPRPQTLDRKLSSRLGSALSLYVDPAHCDVHHRYEVLFRQDLLDYASGDFYSIRRLHGVCVDNAPSTGLLYVESSEQKIPFSETGIVAYDTKTRDRLLVEPLLPEDEFLFQHAFRIHFPRPLSQGDEFDLVYAIRLPGELKVLSPKSEIMSIALVRLDHGVRDLQFNVCLNFRPRAVTAEALVEGGKPIPIEPSPTVEPYVPQEWFEEDLDISWSAEPSKVTWGLSDPEAPLYILRYSV